MSFHAASFFCEARKMIRLDPPAIDTPGYSAARGAGIGAVDHLPFISTGRRLRNSPTFHGPVMYIAKSAWAKLW